MSRGGIGILLSLFLLIVISVYLKIQGNNSNAGDPPGLIDAKLAPCPDKPNCVSTFEGASPFAYGGSRKEARDALLGVLADWPRTEIIQTTDQPYTADNTKNVLPSLKVVDCRYLTTSTAGLPIMRNRT